MSRVTHMRVLMLLMGGLFSAMALATPAELDEVSRQEIAERIAPVGTVCQQGDDCAANAGAVASTSNEPRSGEQIFNQFCTACHTTGLLNAPKLGDEATWKARLSSVGSYGQLLSNAINGINSMPPKGTCMDCSDDEINESIQYMSGLKP